MDKETLRSLRHVVDYLYDDEERHFWESDEPKDHIFRDVRRLALFLQKAEA